MAQEMADLNESIADIAKTAKEQEQKVAGVYDEINRLKRKKSELIILLNDPNTSLSGDDVLRAHKAIHTYRQQKVAK